MEQLLHIRQVAIRFYKTFEMAINYILKFTAGLIIFSSINSLGLYREEFDILFGTGAGLAFAFLLLASVIFAISPPSIALLLVAVVVAIQLSVVVEVAVFVFLLLVLVIVFYARLAPRQCMLILAIIFGLHFRIPYVVVLFAGLYFGITSIIPIVIGVAIWHFLPFFTSLAQTVTTVEELDLFELPVAFLEVFGEIFGQLTTDFNWVIIGFVFTMMILAVHLISLITVNHAKDIAIGVGAMIGMICMVMVVAVIDVNMSVGGIIFGCLLSALLVWVAKFFDTVLDYKRVETVRFDDDENFYYVKIVPKMTVATPQPTQHRAKTAKPTPHPTPDPRRINDTDYGYRSKLYNKDILDDDEDNS